MIKISALPGLADGDRDDPGDDRGRSGQPPGQAALAEEAPA